MCYMEGHFNFLKRATLRFVCWSRKRFAPSACVSSKVVSEAFGNDDHLLNPFEIEFENVMIALASTEIHGIYLGESNE